MIVEVVVLHWTEKIDSLAGQVGVEDVDNTEKYKSIVVIACLVIYKFHSNNSMLSSLLQ